MSVYQHRKIYPLRIVALLLRGLSTLLGSWGWLLMAAIILSPISPHVLIQYRETTYGTYRTQFDCEYFGSRGFVKYAPKGNCPWITIIDRRG
jgi:hypothetical protein